MYRCVELARLGSGFVAPNPLVGSVLVYENKIIGEGWHRKFGETHAEVNCINSVKEENKNLISKSTLYVSLEPCAHFGKTPPCTDLVLKNKIPNVVIGCKDPLQNEKGIAKLREFGVEVEIGVLEKECRELIKRFFTFYEHHRPYIILKWAQTADGKISSGDGNRLFISNEYSNRLVHKWRSEEASILIGTNTAMTDDPELTNRYWNGPSPIRLVVDMDLTLSGNLRLFNGQQPTIVFNKIKHDENTNPAFYKVSDDVSLVQQIVNGLYQMKIQSVLVEGGARLLQSFIDVGMWDEARIISNDYLTIDNGLDAPGLKDAVKFDEQNISSDRIEIYLNRSLTTSSLLP